MIAGMIAKIVVLMLYAALVVYIGIRGSKKTKSFGDFLLGGGNVGPWMTAFSYGTAYFSAVLFIGFAGKIGWEFGISGIWIALGNTVVGVWGTWFILANRVKEYAVEHRVQTMPEFLEHRFDSKFLKFFTSVAIFVFFIPYSAAVFMGLSYLFDSTFHMNYELMLLLIGIFTCVYLVLGGYKSMALLDVIFGMIMSVGVVILVWSCLAKGGGITQTMTSLKDMNLGLTDIFPAKGAWTLWSLVFLTSVAPLAMPQLIQKFYAVKDRQSIKIGMWASSFFALLISCAAYFTGSLTRLFVNQTDNPGAFPVNEVTGAVTTKYDALMPELLNTAIPEFLSVIILLLILSASMSTLAALVLISGSTITKDLYHGFVNKKASDRTLTILVRGASVVFIILAMALALWEPAVIVTMLTIAWGAIASVFLGPFIWGLFNKKVEKIGAIFGSVGGLTTCLVLFGMYGKSFVAQAGSLGMIASLLLVPIVSLIVKVFKKA